MAKRKLFSTLDLKSAYYQIPHEKRNQFRCVLFVVINGVSAFQRIIHGVISQNNLQRTSYLRLTSMIQPSVELIKFSNSLINTDPERLRPLMELPDRKFLYRKTIENSKMLRYCRYCMFAYHARSIKSILVK